ncbi:PqiC family protein [Thalassospira mesophila]|uniref:ABC-type transport auxiliary lipoprotein component domain-containing protein n=1 Tax=Thalassospira mesophila TaxID=1293891 RepID=A0A1Y2L178_9PROT|nr:PqiC family protein [Thalassospira mesophila]OSQ38981.1 hypothetical protein TMES_09780 [Thalassospira mesophila]
MSAVTFLHSLTRHSKTVSSRFWPQGHIRKAGLALTVASVVVLAACSVTPKGRYFVLSPVTTQHPVQSGVVKAVLGIGPIVFPSHLDRAQLVLRTGQNELYLRENDKWAEPLNETARRVLMQDLQDRLSPKRMEAFPWNSRDGVNWQIAVDIDNFEAQPDRTVRLNAQWKIIDFSSGAIVLSNRFDQRLKPASADSADIVATMSLLLGHFADDISGAFNQS